MNVKPEKFVMAITSVSNVTSNAPDHSRLALGGGLLLLASLFGNGLNYVFGIFLARMLGAGDFGLYALCIAIFNGMVMMVLLGFNSGIIKFVSEHLGLNEPKKAKQVVACGLAFCGAGSVLGGMILWANVEWIAMHVYARSELIPLFGLIALALPLAVVSMLMVSALQAFQSIRYTILVKYVWEPAGKFALAWMFLTVGMGLPGVMLGIVLVLVGSVVVAIRGLHQVTHWVIRDFTSMNWTVGEPFVLFCAPLILANIFSAVAPRFDIFLLGYFGQMEQVGIYSAAFQTAAVLSLVLGAFDRTFAPAMSRLIATGDTQGLEKLYQSQTRVVTGIIMYPLVVYLLVGEDLMKLFGSDFAAGYWPLLVLAGAQAWYCATGAASMVLLMGGHSRLVMVNTIGHGLALIALGWFFVPLWGMEGAACAAGLSLAGMNGIQIAQVWRKYRIVPYSTGFMKFLLAGGLSVLVILLAQMWWTHLFFVFWVLLSGLIYVALAVCFKLETEDRKLIGDLFHYLSRLLHRGEPKEAPCL